MYRIKRLRTFSKMGKLKTQRSGGASKINKPM